jgi:DNA-binding XRE family transcriptional regulator
MIKKKQKTPDQQLRKAEEIMASNSLKTTSLDQVLDKHLGKTGTATRDAFERELRVDLLGQAIKQARLELNLTQEQLGEVVGVQKAQISKIENSAKSARFETILRVFEAMGATVNFTVEINKNRLAF